MNRIAGFRWTLAAIFLAISGCSIGPKSTTVQILDPRPQPASSATNQPVPWTLRVVRPETDATRDSNRVLVRNADGQLLVHSSARWIAPAPDLFRTLLVRHLRDLERFAAIDTTATAPDRTLMIDLRRFEVVEAGGGALSAEIGIEARLYDGPSGDLLARQTFDARRPLASSRPAVINQGFEAGLAELLARMSEWVIVAGPSRNPEQE